MGVQYTDRGFRVFAELFDRYDAFVRVQESSDTEGHVWIFVEGGRVDDNDGAALLNPGNARLVAQALLEAADYIEGG